MGLGHEGFPEGSSPEEQRRIADAASELLRRDAALDDSIFTPLPYAVDIDFERTRALMEASPGSEPDVHSLVSLHEAEEAAEHVKEVMRSHTPEEIAAAKELLHRDRHLDDDIFTPPSAIG